MVCSVICDLFQLQGLDWLTLGDVRRALRCNQAVRVRRVAHNKDLIQQLLHDAMQNYEQKFCTLTVLLATVFNSSPCSLKIPQFFSSRSLRSIPS